MKIANIETTKKIGEEIELAGWVHARRDHGKIIFIDLRDRTGLLQIVFNENLYEKAKTLGPEFVVAIKGLVKERPEGAKNEKIPTGTVEIEAKDLEILAKAKVPPFDPTEDTHKVNEDKRMEYRYIDIRSERMRKNLELRGKIIKYLRDYLDKLGFLEIETPDLTKSTPEGARDYLVPSRVHPGQFYALPQSPQQFKQLLMVAGIEKYFQIARCFRDEDPRGDRQPEHTQLDLEMSFVEQKDVMKLNEELLVALVKEIVPDKKITQIPFPMMTYAEAIKKYKTDRPDLRKDKSDENELAFCWVIDFPFFEKDKDGKWTFTHNPFSDPMPEDKEKFLAGEVGGIRTTQYDIVLNGNEIGGGSIRSHQPEILNKVFEVLGYSKEGTLSQFGHMFRAFEYGVPPHGGIAWGLDRLVSILVNEESIREVIAFPKTGDGRDLMMSAPSDADQKQLDELKIKVTNIKKTNE
jgi:aspartyl-tRNA synthetase